MSKIVRVYLDKTVSFRHHVKKKIEKLNKGKGISKELNNVLSRNALLTIYKSFVRLHGDYADIIYDQPNNESINSKLESPPINRSEKYFLNYDIQ